MATLIINIKTLELQHIDPTSGLYLFGISAKNSFTIPDISYQVSNRFDFLEPGVYQWAVKHTNSGEIKARGSDIVKSLTGNITCYEKIVISSDIITVPLSEHKILMVSDVICYESVNGVLTMFIPDDVIKNLDGSITVTTNRQFTGSIYIC